MIEFLKYGLKLCMRVLLRVYWLMPIKETRIFFMSTFGKSYSCNPRYLYESMINDPNFNEYQMVWCFQRTDDKNLPGGDRLLIIKRRNVVRFFYFLLTSRIVIYNCGGFSYAPIRKKQFLIETWHGGPYKKFDCSLETKSTFSKKGVELAVKNIKLFLSPSELSTEHVIHRSMHYWGDVLPCGFPRNDILIHEKNCRETWKRYIGIGERKMALYAPTFKGKENQAENINFKYEVISPSVVKEVLKKRFGGEWIFAVRGHQYAGGLTIEGADLDLSAYPEMQELLLATDVLITDYSSSIWDFALLNRLCILFAPDLNDYENNDRGFQTPFKEWPGIYAGSNIEIEKVVMQFNQELYDSKIQQYLLDSGSYENGTACEQTKKYMLTKMGESGI